MKYSVMSKFLNDNGINSIQPVIADEVNAQLEVEIDEKEFEDVCDSVYNKYLDCINIDIGELVNDELTVRGYK